MQFNGLKEARHRTGQYITYAPNKASRAKNVYSGRLETIGTYHSKDRGVPPSPSRKGGARALKGPLFNSSNVRVVRRAVLSKQNKDVCSPDTDIVVGCSGSPPINGSIIGWIQESVSAVDIRERAGGFRVVHATCSLVALGPRGEGSGA